MSKCYEDLSRRGLIRLGHDFDEDNGGMLQHYLAEHGDEYENIRPVECVIERTDQVVETVSNTVRRVKNTFLNKDRGNVASAVIDTIVDNADVIKSGIGVVTAALTK